MGTYGRLEHENRHTSITPVCLTRKYQPSSPVSPLNVPKDQRLTVAAEYEIQLELEVGCSAGYVLAFNEES